MLLHLWCEILGYWSPWSGVGKDVRGSLLPNGRNLPQFERQCPNGLANPRDWCVPSFLTFPPLAHADS